jgi:hypothetical protein
MGGLRLYIREQLGVLFVALNPPRQSDSNGHWFSGKLSRFFDLLHKSGLITKSLQKDVVDEIVFGSSVSNYRNFEFGVIDLLVN